MSTPGMMPATYESVTAVGNKLSDTRADLLVGQGQILKNAGDNTSAILRDANNNTQFTNANIERNALAGMQETVRGTERLSSQANTVAWNEMGLQDAGFAAQRAQTERINDAQSAFSDRAAKFNAQMISDSFARLSAQGENGFARGLDATVAGFRDISASTAANYASLSQQNCQTKEVVAAYGNRAADHTASVLATLSAQHSDQTRDMAVIGRELTAQAANNAGAIQLEGAKNSAASQLQASVNAKDAALQAAMNAKDAALQAAVNAKELAMQSSLQAKESLLENSKWFALAEKTAMVNKCELESKLAACCCEIKESVIGTANATQSLIQSNESARVRDALSAAVAENSILRLRREERPPYPVPYPVPYHHHHHRSESPRRDRDDRR
jgi:hypothetical protein